MSFTFHKTIPVVCFYYYTIFLHFFQRILHHDLSPQTAYPEKIFTRRQRVAIGDSFPKKHYNIKTNPNRSLVTSTRFGVYFKIGIWLVGIF